MIVTFSVPEIGTQVCIKAFLKNCLLIIPIINRDLENQMCFEF